MEKYYLISDENGYLLLAPTCDSGEEALIIAKEAGIKRNEIASVKIAFRYKYFKASLNALKKFDGDKNKTLEYLYKSGFNTYTATFQGCFAEAISVF